MVSVQNKTNEIQTRTHEHTHIRKYEEFYVANAKYCIALLEQSITPEKKTLKRETWIGIHLL